MAVEPIVITITGSSTEAVASVDKLVASLKAVQVETGRVAGSMKAMNTELAASTKAMQTMSAESAKAGTAAAAGARKAETSWLTTSRTMSSVGRSMTKYLTLPIIGVGAAAVDLSVKFHNSMLIVQTHAGATHAEITKMSKAILNLTASGKYAQGPRDFATALYQIESAGIRGSKALDVLKNSADLAAVGHANFADTTKSVVSVEQLALKGTGNLSHAVGTLNATVGAGRLYMDDLNVAIGTGFLTNAKQAGVSLRDASAALDLLTRQGMPAAQAATRLRFGFSLLAHPTDAAAKALAGVGISSDEVGKKMRGPGGLLAGIQDLKAHLDKLPGGSQGQAAGDVLTKAFGGARSSVGILAMIQNTKELSGIMKEITKNTAEFQQSVAATRASPVFQLKAAWAQIQTALIRIGDDLLPTMLPIVVAIAKGTAAIFGWWDKLPSALKTASGVMALIVAAAGPLVVIAASLIRSWIQITELMGTSSKAQTTLVTEQEALNTQGQIFVGTQEEIVALMREQGVQSALIAENMGMASRMAATGANVMVAGGAKGGKGGIGGMFGGSKGVGMAAMGGLLVSQIAGQAIGGNTGNAVSTIGGGASTGAMIGMMAGPEGAAIGAALGAAAGIAMNKGIRDAIVKLPSQIGHIDIGSIFSGGSHDSMSQSELLVKKIATANEALTNAMKKQAPAVKTLASSSNVLTNARKREHTATAAVHKAELARNAAVKRFGPESRQAAAAEGRLAQAKTRDAQATQRLTTLERVHGAARQALKVILREENRQEVILIDSLKAHTKATYGHIAAMVKEKRPPQQIAAEYSKWRQETNQLREAQDKHAKTLKDASDKIGPKFASSLSKINALQADLGKSGDKAGTQVANAMRKIGTQATQSAQTAYQGDSNLVANIQGIGKTFQFPVPAVQLTPPGGKQYGGTVVPGSGSGDKVHMQAMVEPGEGVFVLNKNAMGALSQLNADIPRFKSGGGLTHPMASGSGTNKDMTQKQLDMAFSGMNKWVNKHMPSAQMVKFAQGIASKHYPYVFGGGHSSFAPPYDCSGYVSAILHAGHLLGSPITTDGLKTYGDPGPGKQVTIGVRGSTGANAHTMMQIGNHFFESGGGHGAAEDAGWDGSFPIKRHPPGMQTGGNLLAQMKKKGLKFSMDPMDPGFVGWGLQKGGIPAEAQKNYDILWEMVKGRFGGGPPPRLAMGLPGHGYTYTKGSPETGPERTLYGSKKYMSALAHMDPTKGSGVRNASFHEWAFETRPWSLGEGGANRIANKTSHYVKNHFQKGGALKFHDSVHDLFGTHFDKDELTTLASFVGMPNPSLMGAIAYAESTGNPGATGHNTNGTTDRGLWQINSSHGSQSTYAVLANAMAAKSILGSQGLSAWSTYNNGKYKQYLGGHVQQDLLQKMKGTSGPSSISSSGSKTTKEVRDFLLAHPTMTQDQFVKYAAKHFNMGKKAARTAYQSAKAWLAKHPGGTDSSTTDTSAYDTALQNYTDYLGLLSEAGRYYTADRALSMRLGPVMAGFASEQNIPLLGPYGDIPTLNLPDPGLPPAVAGAGTSNSSAISRGGGAAITGHGINHVGYGKWALDNSPAKLDHHHHHTVSVDKNGNIGLKTQTKTTDRDLGRKSRHHSYAPGH